MSSDCWKNNAVPQFDNLKEKCTYWQKMAEDYRCMLEAKQQQQQQQHKGNVTQDVVRGVTIYVDFFPIIMNALVKL